MATLRHVSCSIITCQSVGMPIVGSIPDNCVPGMWRVNTEFNFALARQTGFCAGEELPEETIS